MSMQAQSIRSPAQGCHDGRVPNSAAIEVVGLRKAYGAHEAVRGLTFSVQRGEVFGLLGPNGAGKTTTVEILEGYRRRDAGTARVLGHDPGERPAELRDRVGIVLQSCGTYPHLSVRETVAYWASLYAGPRDVDEVIALAGLEEAADRRARTLSGGQQRRLDFALALIGDPELIFLDEPTVGFDPAARRAAWDTVRALRALGKTILLTTHYLDEAQALADRVAIVKDGQILAEGRPSELGAGGTARYRVSWRDAAGATLERDTDDPTALLHELTGAALARGERLDDLSVTRPTLEDVYLELTAAAA
jgi:ABC-2 type transport system ATP-binding protein